MLNAASLVELKLSAQSDSECLDCGWTDISSEHLLVRSTSISVSLSVFVGLSVCAECFLQHTVLKRITV